MYVSLIDHESRHSLLYFVLIDSLNSNSNNIVLIGSVSAVIIVCIMATITLVAIVLYRKGEHLVVVDFWSLSVPDDDSIQLVSKIWQFHQN